MLPWSWVTRACSLNFKCSQPDYSFPYCDGGGEGFEGRSLLQYTFRRELKISVCLLLKILQENVLSYKIFFAALNPNSHFFGSSVPGCSSSCPQGSAAGIPALRNSSWASGRAVLCVSNAASLPTLSVGITLELPWQKPEGLVWRSFFT